MVKWLERLCLVAAAVGLSWIPAARADLAADMVAGIDRYLSRAIDDARESRAKYWNRDLSSPEAYSASVQANRERLGRILGVVDPRVNVAMDACAPAVSELPVAESEAIRVYEVRWPVLQGVTGEGLLLEPKTKPVANVVALPDCDWSPEMLAGLEAGVASAAQFARHLAERGCRVLVPQLMNRDDTWSGNPAVRMTNQPHREYIYRPAYQMGRHIIGYEIQKTAACVDWFKSTSTLPVAVAGYGEGGLLALYAGALDTRIDATLVSGYFGPREGLWSEPIYRNVWGLLEMFGDAELASLIAPRALVVETSEAPRVDGPPAPSDGRSGAAPGRIQTPAIDAVVNEFNRARALVDGLHPAPEFILKQPKDGLPGSADTLDALMAALGVPSSASVLDEPPHRVRPSIDPSVRLKRQFDELLEHTQRVMRDSPKRRAEFWSKADDSSSEAFIESSRWYRNYFWDEIIGRFPEPEPMTDARTRRIYDTPDFEGFEVVLDVYPDVFAYGILLVPKGMAPDEKRPVVVCQHGLEGRAEEVTDPASDSHYYHRYGCRLAEQGFVVFAPQNPYIGADDFRTLQRKANPLKKSLFGIITRQHQRILEWLANQPYVDPARIAFYGLSYGGKTAMRVPALLDGYCLSICSGDFNEWIWKTVSADSSYSYLFTGEYEMFEFGIGETFNYGELSGLIYPRPFMVERGHHDGVAPDEWVTYEYAKARRRYALFGLGDSTTIEYFNGPHEIHGVGTFDFLHRQLKFQGRQP